MNASPTLGQSRGFSARIAGHAKSSTRPVKLWDSAGPEGFTIRKLALQLKVVRFRSSLLPPTFRSEAPAPRRGPPWLASFRPYDTEADGGSASAEAAGPVGGHAVL